MNQAGSKEGCAQVLHIEQQKYTAVKAEPRHVQVLGSPIVIEIQMRSAGCHQQEGMVLGELLMNIRMEMWSLDRHLLLLHAGAVLVKLCPVSLVQIEWT
jgi:hypothetical protein